MITLTDFRNWDKIPVDVQEITEVQDSKYYTILTLTSKETGEVTKHMVMESSKTIGRLMQNDINHK